jgi:hypothetical protein
MQCSVLVLLVLLVMLPGRMRQEARMQPQLQRHVQLGQQPQQRFGQPQQQQQLACQAAAAAVLRLGCGKLLPRLLARRLRLCLHLAAMRLALVLLQQQLRPSSTSLVAVVVLQWPEQQQQRLRLCRHRSSSSSLDCRLRHLLYQLLQTAALLLACGQPYLRLQHRAKPVQQQQQHQWALRGQQQFSQHLFRQCMATHVAPAAATAPGGSSSSMWCSTEQRSNLMAAATCMEVSLSCVVRARALSLCIGWSCHFLKMLHMHVCVAGGGGFF